MSLFPRFAQEFTPLFQIINDYDQAARSLARGHGPSFQSFQPKFDVKETKDSYELHGELPGIEQKHVSVEWTDGTTLSISGRIESHTERGTPPRAAIAGAPAAESTSATESANDKADSASEPGYVKPSVSDEDGDETSTVAGEANALTPATTNAGEVTKSTEPTAKYWVSERSVGAFHRSFTFPARVDHEAVKANLKNGILSIVVPKAKITEPRKINVE